MSISARNNNNVVPIRAWPFVINNRQDTEAGYRENKTAIQDQIDKAKALFFKAGGKIQKIKTGHTDIDYGQKSLSRKEFLRTLKVTQYARQTAKQKQ